VESGNSSAMNFFEKQSEIVQLPKLNRQAILKVISKTVLSLSLLAIATSSFKVPHAQAKAVAAAAAPVEHLHVGQKIANFLRSFGKKGGLAASFLRPAIVVNGAFMLAWSPFLFFRHLNIISKVEGRKVAAKKTKFDVMIWRITGLWVAFVGLTCLFVTDVPNGFWSSRWGFSSPEALEVVWSPLAYLLLTTHTIETWVKYDAGALSDAKANIFLAGISLVALLLP